MTRQDRFWKVLAVAVVAGLFYVGYGLQSRARGGEGLARSANAQMLTPGSTVDSLDTIITSSTDGRTLYVWSYQRWDHDRDRLPIFRGEVVAE